MTYTLEAGYGSKIVVPGAGFLLNNEMGDFNAAPELTTAEGLIGTKPNLARARQADAVEHVADDPRAKTVSCSWSPAAPAGAPSSTPCSKRSSNVVDFGMNAQEAIDAPRFHHQWLPDRLDFEKYRPVGRHGRRARAPRAQRVRAGTGGQGVAQVIVYNAKEDMIEGGTDRRASDGAAVGSARADDATEDDRGETVTSGQARLMRDARAVGACLPSSSMNSPM